MKTFRLQTAAGTLVAGWLLMLPPLQWDNGQGTVLLNVPIARWDQESAHDAAKDCERAKQDRLTLALRARDNPANAKSRDSLQVAVDRASHGRCVPAAAVYSMPTPGPP